MMQNRGAEEHKIWLFDLAHGNLTDQEIVKGFIKYYALNGFTLGNVQDDLVFKTCYPVAEAIKHLKGALEIFAE